jgi:hypothetical protein
VFGFLSGLLNNLDIEKLSNKLSEEMPFKLAYMENLNTFLEPMLDGFREHFKKINQKDTQ